MRKQKKNTNQKNKKTKDGRKKSGDDTQCVKSEVAFSLINEEYNYNFRKNFYIKSIRTDGNCLFRAVADQLYNDEEEYKEIRKRVVEHLLKKEEEYKHFIENDESFKSYIERISVDGTWGGQLELQAIGEIFSVNILIYQENGCILEIKNHDETNKCIQLHYASNEHYNSVRFRNKAQDELKTIFDLREILNSKDDNDSSKTFYETTDNEITDEGSSIVSMNGKENKNINIFETEENMFGPNVRTDMRSGGFSEYQYDANSDVRGDGIRNDIRNGHLVCESKGMSNYATSKNGTSEYDRSEYNIDNNVGLLMEDDSKLRTVELLQIICNDVKKKNHERRYKENKDRDSRKYRSKSMPNINEDFLYFFSKNRITEKLESDSTIDSLNEEKTIKKKQKQKKLKNKKIIFLKCTFFNEQTKDINEFFSKKTIKEPRITRVCYNKMFHKQLYMFDKIQTKKHFDYLEKERRGDMHDTEETDVGEEIEGRREVEEVEKRECSVKSEWGNNGYFSNYDLYSNMNIYGSRIENNDIEMNRLHDIISYDGNRPEFFCTTNGKEKIENKRECKSSLVKPKTTSKRANFFDIIVDDFEMTIHIDSFFAEFNNKCATDITKKKSTCCVRRGNADARLSDQSSDSSAVNMDGRDFFDSMDEMRNSERMKEKELTKMKNIKDLILKKKYHNEKFVQMFSKDFYTRGLFNFINADFFLYDNELHYIVEFFCRYKKINIFKKQFDKYDFYYSDNLMFSFRLDNEIMAIKQKMSKETYKEFVIKAERKYKSILTKCRKWKKKNESNRVKIISL